MSGSPTNRQTHYRHRIDGGVASDVTEIWGAAQDTDWYPGLGTPFRLRLGMDNTGTGAMVTGPQLRVSKNGGAYQAVTTTSTIVKGTDASPTASSASDASLTTTTFDLTAGSGTAVAGRYSEAGNPTSPKTGAGNYTEVEFGLQIVAADVAAGDTIDFRLQDGVTVFTTYSVTPRITIPAVPSAPGSPVSYQLSDTASDLTGATVNKKLVSTGAVAGTWAGQSLGGNNGNISSIADASFFTEAGTPDTGGPSSTTKVPVSLDITTGNANFRYAARATRVNSSGVVQAYGALSAESTSGATGVYTVDCYTTGLGTWASGDRLRIDVRIRNNSTSTAQSATLSYATGNSWIQLGSAGAATANGGTVTATASIATSGSATGEASAAGATLTATASIIAGSAGVSVTATGATLTATASLPTS